ncbi:MAG: Type IV-A pilus assembly ATPase PilB [Candidatus Uhrbacteria bacterium GW2011_GWD2_52_7]|uniref:Type IV-A pilus assembly ATPase PilB n=1 Tax=Candidatus Uhrbacteria bacterium GW2011_GWD2_52_7 TaxID=1618989 RepID=A0A0G2ADG3_9BACT|nr:MAG: Type IV-A pilus assembly ATPase PilB [Candidatus Uhrbacteria bacterium GW2011_GWD2_52_7]
MLTTNTAGAIEKSTTPPVSEKPTEATKPTGPLPTKADIDKLIGAATKGENKDAAVKLFEQLMIFAHAARASDVHIEPWKDHAIARVRVDGILHDEFTLESSLQVQLIARLKILTRMRTDEHHAPQDGRFKFTSPLGDVDVRASILPTAFGEKAVLRLLSSQSHQLTLEQLGFSETDLTRIQRAIHKPWGMILATGPTGSGKTTSIYAILEVLNTREVNISTIEDPVEFEIPGTNQSQVDHVAKLTFATGLRALLRQDPDIIMVGEIRDQETAKIAVNAAMTGHKLLSTLHTNNSATTIPRLVDMGVEPFLIASTFICAIAQRLLRRICTDCMKTETLTREDAAKIYPEPTVLALFKDQTSIEVVKTGGCAKCNESGYRGRVGIYEVLENSPAIQDLIVKHASSDEIEALARKEGMTTILEDGAHKVLNKETTVEELIRVMQE